MGGVGGGYQGMGGVGVGWRVSSIFSADLLCGVSPFRLGGKMPADFIFTYTTLPPLDTSICKERGCGVTRTCLPAIDV